MGDVGRIGAYPCWLSAGCGFLAMEVLPPGQTRRLIDPGELDLREREIESLYLEAEQP